MINTVKKIKERECPGERGMLLCFMQVDKVLLSESVRLRDMKT